MRTVITIIFSHVDPLFCGSTRMGLLLVHLGAISTCPQCLNHLPSPALETCAVSTSECNRQVHMQSQGVNCTANHFSVLFILTGLKDHRSTNYHEQYSHNWTVRWSSSTLQPDMSTCLFDRDEFSRNSVLLIGSGTCQYCMLVP